MEGLYSGTWYLSACDYTDATLWRSRRIRIHELVFTLPRRQTLPLQMTPNQSLPTSDPDQDGPIWGYHFVPNQPAQSITSEAAVEFLTAPGPPIPDEFLWLHFSLSNVASEPWLRRYLTLPDTFYESLQSDIDATHLEQDGDSLVARVHDVLFDFTFDAPVATTSLCVKPRVLVSAHVRPWRSIDQLRAAVQAGQVFRSPIEVLSRLLRDQARVLVDIVRKSTKRVAPMEERLLAKHVQSVAAKFSTAISDTAALVER